MECTKMLLRYLRNGPSFATSPLRFVKNSKKKSLTQNSFLNCRIFGFSVADLGGTRDAPPGPKFLHFHPVFGKNRSNNM